MKKASDRERGMHAPVWGWGDCCFRQGTSNRIGKGGGMGGVQTPHPCRRECGCHVERQKARVAGAR